MRALPVLTMACLTVLALGTPPSSRATAPAQPELLLTTEELPPFNMQTGTGVGGISADKVIEIMRRAGLSYKIEMMPWARALHTAEATANSCAFSTTRIPERENRFKWIGPLTSNNWVLFGLAERKFYLKSIEDARSMRIGTYLSDVRDTYLRSRDFNVDSATTDTVNPQKLMMGRIDLWAAGYFQGRLLIEKSHLADKIVPVLVFNRADLFLACNLSLPDASIQAMQTALDQITRDGTSATIEHRYADWAASAAAH